MDTSDGDASWVVLGAGQLQGSKAPAASMPAGAFDFTELQQRVIAFNAGDEKYSGEWLTNFQRTPAAWDACVEALRTGAPTSLDEEFLQEFCAQTLARLGRTFGARHAEASRRSLREELELLLTIHAQGRAPVWRQLALALTCADLWIGDWSPERVVGPLGSSLPAALRRELLSLPAELLFCDRALPLDNPKLRHAAASALLEACSEVFPVLVDIEDGGEEGARLRVVAAWLRVLRKCLRVLPTFDAAGPLRALAAQGVELMILAEASPENAVEVAQQLARWRCSHAEVAELLRPLLECIFRSPLEESGRQALLPLLADLASDCWPRAAFGDLDLAWEDIAEQALLVLAEARAAPDYGEECDDGHDVDAEAALELWGTFAETVREGVRELPGPPTLDEVAQASGEGEQAAKRSRVGETWRPSTERIAHAEALQRLFAGLSHKLLELMVAPSDFLVTGGEALIGLWDLRRVAEGVLRAWATLVGRSAVLEEATWAPLHRVGQTLTAAAASGDPACIDDGVWRDAEVVLWFSAALAAGWPDNASGAVPPVALAVPELGVIDAAPPPWRALLWASAAGLAATAPADRCPQMIEWMLLRPPASAGVPELMAVTELPYAHALERACRRLPGDVAHAAAGEQIATLAFVDRPPAALHEETPKAQRTLLLAMRHALGSDLAILCQGLSGSILPGLRTAVESEREAFVGEESEAPFLAAQALFATLATAVPPVDSSSSAVGADTSAAIALWKSHWGYVEDAMLNRACNKATEQPLAAAADALTTAALALPELLAPAAELLAKSAARRSEMGDVPELQLKAIQTIVQTVRCQPGDAPRVADTMAAAVLAAGDSLLMRPKDLLETPAALTTLFALNAEAVRASPPGTSGVAPCDDQLRPRLLSQPMRFMGRHLEIVGRALPECTAATGSTAMLRYVARLAPQGSDAPEGLAAHRGVLVGCLPELCKVVVAALATQGHLAEDLDALLPAAEVLFAYADAFPAEFSAALASGLSALTVTPWSRQRLATHVAARADWKRSAEWLEHLQQIVQEWQRELRHVQL